MSVPPIEVGARRGERLGMRPECFLRRYWQKRPLLIHGAFPGFAPPLSADDLAGLACIDGVLARIVGRSPRKAKPRNCRRHVADGNHQTASRDRWQVRTGPFDEATFAKLPDSHWTLLVQDVDKWDPDTRALLDHFAFLPSWRIDDVMVSYAADQGGVGAHVDQYDVFLLQGSGQRRWRLDTRPNPATDCREDVELKLLREFSPTHEWVVRPGDILYLPPGVPHEGVAVGDCMTFSIGMRAPADGELLMDFATHVAERLPESRRFHDPDLIPATAAGEIDAAALLRARRALGPAAALLDDAAFADWFGRFITRYRTVPAASARKRPIAVAALADRLQRSVVIRDPWSRFAWHRRDGDAMLYVSGAAFRAPLRWAVALTETERKLSGASLLHLPQRARGLGLLKALIDAGHIRLRAA